jgi:outer membrane immunogenic protein
LAVALSTIAGSAAFAADLPPPVAPPRAPAVYVPAPVPYYNWTGFYIGGNLGASWQQGSFSDPNGNNFSTNNQFTGTGGGQVGVNYEFSGGVVVGAEAMFDWRFNNGNTSNTVALVNAGVPTGSTASITVNNQWLTTATGKLGYAWDRTLVYAKAGGAWVGSNNPTINLNGVGTTFSTSNSNWGWTVGAGIEYAFAGTWSARVEYDYVGLTNQTFTLVNGGGGLPAGDQFTGNSRNIQLLTAGINYKFGGWGY